MTDAFDEKRLMEKELLLVSRFVGRESTVAHFHFGLDNFGLVATLVGEIILSFPCATETTYLSW